MQIILKLYCQNITYLVNLFILKTKQNTASKRDVEIISNKTVDPKKENTNDFTGAQSLGPIPEKKRSWRLSMLHIAHKTPPREVSPVCDAERTNFLKKFKPRPPIICALRDGSGCASMEACIRKQAEVLLSRSGAWEGDPSKAHINHRSWKAGSAGDLYFTSEIFGRKDEGHEEVRI